MISEKELRSAAKELQSVLIMDPPIDSKAKLAVLTEQVKEAIEEIKPGDEFSEETQAVIDELSGAGEEEEEIPAPKKKVVKKAAPVEEEEEEAEAEEESLIDQVTAAPLKLSIMTAFVKENAELKPLVKKLATFEKASALKAAILELLTPEEEEVAPLKKMAAKVAGAKTKTAAVDEDEEEEEPANAKKKGTGKTPFKSTKDTLGTTRMIEVAKAMQAIKGTQTIDAIAATADARFIKAGGVSNVKQSKNIIKVLLPAAEEWGIVVDKAGKLANA